MGKRKVSSANPLKNARIVLDAAAATTYGWPAADLTDGQILEKLLV